MKLAPGPKAIPEEMVSVGIRPDVHVVSGELSARDLEALTKWVEVNGDVLVKYWDGDLLTDEALGQI